VRRLLVVSPDYPPQVGGIQRLVHALAQHVTRFERRVVTLAQPGAAAWDRAQPGPEVVRAARLPIPYRARVAVLNARALAAGLRFRPHVVLNGHIVTSPMAAALRHGLGIPFVQYLHSEEMALHPAITRFALREAAAVIAVSGHTARMALHMGVDPQRLFVIPPGVDLPSERRREPAEQPTILTLATLDRRYKGHDVMLRAMPLVRARVAGARWIVAGDGRYRARLETMTRAHGLDDAVVFRGRVSDEERDRLFRTAWVFTMPSRLSEDEHGGEGFGIVYTEAGAHGLPVVAGNVGGALDAVVPGETGLLVDPLDHVELADAVATLLEDRARAASMGEAGARLAGRLAWRNVADRVSHVLTKAAMEGAGG
jgi:phosphatidylinositol alpha-1,6-mannosyltransferase